MSECDYVDRENETYRFLLGGPSGLTLLVATFLGDGERDSDPEEAERGMVTRLESGSSEEELDVSISRQGC
jgi:hypothetical protein